MIKPKMKWRRSSRVPLQLRVRRRVDYSRVGLGKRRIYYGLSSAPVFAGHHPVEPLRLLRLLNRANPVVH
ncbi:hypothetical protein BH10CYA1_BH10CYA1_00270 [soil metagenome]